MASITRFLKRYPVLFFFLLAYLLSWPASLLPGENAVLAILSVAGPTLAAVLMMWALERRDGPGDLFARLFQWRAHLIWYVVAILGPFVLSSVTVGLVLLLGDATPNVAAQIPWGALPAIVVGRLLVNVWEEIGWRGFALPQLQSRYNALVASLILGLLWGIWHIPLFLSGAMPPGLPVATFFVEIVAISVIYTWIYNNTEGSLLFVTLFHVFENTAGILVLESGLDFTLFSTLRAVLVVVAAIALVALYQPTLLSRDVETVSAV